MGVYICSIIFTVALMRLECSGLNFKHAMRLGTLRCCSMPQPELRLSLGVSLDLTVPSANTWIVVKIVFPFWVP